MAKLSNYLVLAAQCSRCRALIRTPFSQVAQRRELVCDSCGQSWGFDLDGDALRDIDQNFRRLEDPIRDSEAWVEIQVYP